MYLCGGKEMKERLKEILSSRLLRDSGKLLSANVVAQAVGLIIYPVLTRLYSQADFGLLSLFVSISNVLVLISTLEYQYAIVITNSKQKSRAAVHLSLFLLTIFSLLLVFLLPLRHIIARWFNADGLAECMWLLPIFVLFGGIWNILNLYLTRKKRFGVISHYKVSSSLWSAGCKLGFGYAGIWGLGLVYSTVIAPVISLLSVVTIYLRKQVGNIFKIDYGEVISVAKEYKRLPMFSLPRALVNCLGGSLPALILASAFSLEELGFFSMALMLAFMPVSTVIGSVQQVLFQQTADAVNNHRSIKHRLYGLIRNTLFVVVPFFAILYFILPWLTELLLGAGWAQSGIYIRYMLPWLVFVCLNGLVCFVADVFMQQKIGFVFECVILIARVIGMVVGIVSGSFTIAVIGYCVMTTLALFAQLIWFFHLINNYEKNLKSV